MRSPLTTLIAPTPVGVWSVKDVLAHPEAVDPAVLHAARQAEAPLEHQFAHTSRVAPISGAKATAAEADFAAMQAHLAELQKVKAKADHDVEAALLRLNPQIAAFTRALESLGKTSALQQATEAIKQATELRKIEEAQVKKYIDALGKKGAEIGDVIGQMGDAMLEALDAALQKAVAAKQAADAAARRAASPQ